jgi:hypothetical protein
MKRRKRNPDLKYAVVLTAFDRAGNAVKTLHLNTETYYDAEVPLLENFKLLKSIGATRVHGQHFDEFGRLDREWESFLDKSGRRIGGRSRDWNSERIADT